MSNQEHTDGLTRRTLIKSTALGSLALAAGGLSLPFSLSHAAAAVQDAARGEERIVWGACSVNCGSRCALRSHVRDDEVVWVETDNTGADIYGDHQVRACLRGRSIRRRINHPDRLNYPMKRVGKRGEGKFVRISWEEALDTIADNLKRIVKEYGNEAVYINYLASIIHLGSPLRAFNSLTRVGASALSNEIASGALFFAVGGVWWLLTFLGKMPAILAKAWLLLTMLLGCLFVLEMTLVYQINTVPTWYNAYTTAAFFLTMVLCGPLFAALLLRVANVPFNGTVFASMSVLALLASLAVVILQNSELAEIRSSVQQASALLPNYGWLQILRLAFLTLGLGCWICPLARKKNPRIASLLLGLILVLLGEFIGRGLFYGLHMTVGTAIAG